MVSMIYILALTVVSTMGTQNPFGISEVQPPAHARAAFATHHTRNQKADSAS